MVILRLILSHPIRQPLPSTASRVPSQAHLLLSPVTSVNSTYPFSFDTLANCFVPSKNSTRLFSIRCKLFCKNTRVGGRVSHSILLSRPISIFTFPFSDPFFSTAYTLFSFTYALTPLFATLTKKTGVYTLSSHSGTHSSRNSPFRVPPQDFARACADALLFSRITDHRFTYRTPVAFQLWTVDLLSIHRSPRSLNSKVFAPRVRRH